MFLLASSLLGPTAFAQDRDTSKNAAQQAQSEVAREVVRGYFLKSNIGGSRYFMSYAPLMRSVMNLSLSVGSDFVDNERTSMSWEVMFRQGLFNGPKFDQLSTPEVVGRIQGDVHTFEGVAFFEFSGYVNRRLGIGIKAGGGVMMLPLLMEESAYQEFVVDGMWGGNPAAVHASPLPLVGGGPTIEYYTKLSHFSVGVEADVDFVIGLNDLVIHPSGFLKYTF
jgi:hypothetical protein